MPALARRKSVAVNVGGVKVGGANPIVVQSMTNTDTADTTATVNQVMHLARAGSELVRVTVNTEDAAKAVPTIVKTLRDFGVTVPIIGDFHYNGHILLKKYPDCARALDKYRINPGNVNIGKKQDDNFKIMIEAAIEYNRPVRIGVNWGSLDASLLTQMMDENAKSPEPLDAMEVTRRAIVESALRSAHNAESYGLGRDKDYLERQGQQRAGLGASVRNDGGALRLCAALGVDGSRYWVKGHCGDECGTGGASAARDWRYDSCVADAFAEWRPQRRSDCQPADLAGAEPAKLYTASGSLPGLWPHYKYVLPRHGGPDSNLFARADADLARKVYRRGRDESGRDGLRGERPRRIKACQYRDFVAGHVRNTCSACVCRRQAFDHTARRSHCGRVSRDLEQLCGAAVWASRARWQRGLADPNLDPRLQPGGLAHHRKRQDRGSLRLAARRPPAPILPRKRGSHFA